MCILVRGVVFSFLLQFIPLHLKTRKPFVSDGQPSNQTFEYPARTKKPKEETKQKTVSNRGKLSISPNLRGTCLCSTHRGRELVSFFLLPFILFFHISQSLFFVSQPWVYISHITATMYRNDVDYKHRTQNTDHSRSRSGRASVEDSCVCNQMQSYVPRHRENSLVEYLCSICISIDSKQILLELQRLLQTARCIMLVWLSCNTIHDTDTLHEPVDAVLNMQRTSAGAGASRAPTALLHLPAAALLCKLRSVGSRYFLLSFWVFLGS